MEDFMGGATGPKNNSQIWTVAKAIAVATGRDKKIRVRSNRASSDVLVNL